ncbi:DUF7315 family membrane protein [Haloferacaceae archaeon DSL9]
MTDPERPAERSTSDPNGGRDVVVPMRLYKTVTVFSTLIAAVSVLVGFTLIDAATLQISFVRALIGYTFTTIGIPVAEDLLGAVLATLGLLVIGFGAGVFILGSRFRTAEMGNSQEDSDEVSDNG